MFEQVTSTLMNLLALSVGGISIGSLIVMYITLRSKIKSTALSKDHVEKAFEKAVLPANVKLDISNKIIPLVKSTLKDIELNLKGYVNESFEEILKIKKSIKLILTVLSKFSHVDMLTEEEKNDISDIIRCTDDVKEIEV